MWTSVDILLTTYLCPHGYFCTHPLLSTQYVHQNLDFNLLLTSLKIWKFLWKGEMKKQHLFMQKNPFTLDLSQLLSFPQIIWSLQVCFRQHNYHFSKILSTWTFKRPPTYLAWTIVDIWLTTHPPHLVHVVCEWPQSLSKSPLFESWLVRFILTSEMDKNRDSYLIYPSVELEITHR